MAAHAGGTQVRSGYYAHARSWAFVNIAKDGGTLPGGPESRWVRVPAWAVVLAAPALGGLFVLSMPLIAVGVVAYAVARKAGVGATTGAKEIAATLAPSWAPGEAHLAGKAGRPEAGSERAGQQAPAAASDASLEALARDIEARRDGKA